MGGGKYKAKRVGGREGCGGWWVGGWEGFFWLNFDLFTFLKYFSTFLVSFNVFPCFLNS